MSKPFIIFFGMVLAVLVGVPIAALGLDGAFKLGSKPATVAAAPTRTVEDVRTQWGGNKPKVVEHAGTVQERARWACSEALERVAVDPKSLRWTRRSQWVSAETDPGVWQVHAHFMARNSAGNDVAATAVCTMRFRNDEFFMVKG